MEVETGHHQWLLSNAKEVTQPAMLERSVIPPLDLRSSDLAPAWHFKHELVVPSADNSIPRYDSHTTPTLETMYATTKVSLLENCDFGAWARLPCALAFERYLVHWSTIWEILRILQDFILFRAGRRENEERAPGQARHEPLFQTT